MDTKRIILCAIILMIAITSLSMVSAGWFDTNQKDTSKNETKLIPTELKCDVLFGNSSVEFAICYNDSDSKLQYVDGIVYYNLTDEDGNIESYNRTILDDGDGIVDIPRSDDTKQYIISAYFPGDDKYAPSSVNITLTVPGSSSSSADSSSSDENPFEDLHTDLSTPINPVRTSWFQCYW